MGQIRATFAVTNPDDRVSVELGGSQHTIPYIHLGDSDGLADFEIHVNSLLLTPEQQAAWLRNLAEQVSSLAVMVERRTNLEVVSA